MRFLNIEKDGIKNVIDEGQFYAIYQPAGWTIIGGEDADKIVEKTAAPTDEIVKKNTNRMKRTAPKKFDDHLIKEDNTDGAL